MVSKRLFIAIILIVFFLGTFFGIAIGASETSDDRVKLRECQNQLNKYQNQIKEIQEAWGDYLDSMDYYCLLDPYNLLCMAR